MAIDPTARVAASARIADGADIGPYCVVGPRVEIGSNARLIAHVHVAGVTTIGEDTVVHPFASVGSPPQSIHYHGGPTRLVIGVQCQLREGVSINTGTEDGGGITRIGDRCFLMAGSHVAHDCAVGNDVTLANNVALGGHVTIGDQTFLGGQAAVHQFVRVGEGVMVGGVSGVAHDVIPFGYALGQVANLGGLNIIGLRRRGMTSAELLRLRRAYRALFLGKGRFAARVDETALEFAGDPWVERIIAFIRAGGKRPLMHPRVRGAAETQTDDAD